MIRSLLHVGMTVPIDPRAGAATSDPRAGAATIDQRAGAGTSDALACIEPKRSRARAGAATVVAE